MPEIDQTFLDFPLDDLADAALSKARELRASHAEFRFERTRSQGLMVRDRQLEQAANVDTVGLSVRVIVDGSWGFAADGDVSKESAAKTAARAVEAASVFHALNSEKVELADEPAYQDTWVSEYEVNPFDVGDGDKIDRLMTLSDKVFESGKMDHVTAFLHAVQENKYFASLAGSRITQQRIRTNSELDATKVDKSTGTFDNMRSTSPPVGRGYEYLTGGYDYAADAERIPDLLEEKMRSRSVEPGRYDLVIHPSNLWLVIHESIGHSTELDRALGYEATMAGTSFATIDKLNELHIGSDAMNVTGDRVAPGGVSTVGYDDEGVKAQTWDLIKEGVLVGYQVNRQMASKVGRDRSNGCAYADSPWNVPIQRMPNVTLKPSPKPISLDDLIGGVERGYIHSRRQELEHRSAALQLSVLRPTVLGNPRRQAGRAAQRRCLPGKHHRLLEQYGGRRRRGNLHPVRGLQLRQRASSTGCPGGPRHPGGSLPQRQCSQRR